MKIVKMLTLLGTLLITSSCLKTVIVDRYMVDFQNQQCLRHSYNLFENKVLSDTEVMPNLEDCDEVVGFTYETWATKVSPALNNLNRRARR
jgi:hypothetical protein